MGVLKKKQPLSSLLVCGLLMYLADIKYDNQTANKKVTSEAVGHVAEIMNRKFVLFPINNEITYAFLR